MRNLFDQYEQPENKLTHALMVSLDRDRKLLQSFLEWIGTKNIPSVKQLEVAEQAIPGVYVGEADEFEQRGLPDGFISHESWAVVIECKVQDKLKRHQLDRHIKTAERSGFPNPYLIAITVEPFRRKLPLNCKAIQWTDIYQWLGQLPKSVWARDLRRYMEIFEFKMLQRNYQIRGTITVFDGFHFARDYPYNYSEAKRLIRLLGDDLQSHPKLLKLGVEPEGSRRGSITGKDHDAVWDFLPLAWEGKGDSFTSAPHLTFCVKRKVASAAVTIPNGVKGGLKTRLKQLGPDGFLDLILKIEKSLRQIGNRTKSYRPMLYVVQRHYLSQSSPATIDASLNVDIRTAVSDEILKTKYQPQWIQAMYEVLLNKKSNMQLGLEVMFDYECPVIRSADAINLFAETMVAIHPLTGVISDKE